MSSLSSQPWDTISDAHNLKEGRCILAQVLQSVTGWPQGREIMEGEFGKELFTSWWPGNWVMGGAREADSLLLLHLFWSDCPLLIKASLVQSPSTWLAFKGPTYWAHEVFFGGEVQVQIITCSLKDKIDIPYLAKVKCTFKIFSIFWYAEQSLPNHSSE